MKWQQLWDTLHVGGAAVGAFLGWFLGGLEGAIYVLVAFSVLDYITCVSAAAVRKELSSETSAKGIVKKIVIFGLVGVGHLFDAYLLGDVTALRTALIFWYIGNGDISLLENTTYLGVPIPPITKDALLQIKKEGEKPNEEEK
jgi:toxin secretion/phage lysis holin